MSKNWKWLALVALLACLTLAAAACGGEEAATGAPTPPPPTATPIPPTPTPEPTEEEVAFSAVVKPTGVDSFRSRVEVTWQGVYTDDTEALGSMAIAAEFVNEPRAEHLTLTGNVPGLGGADLAEGQTIEMYVVKGKLYTNILGGWMQLPADTGGLDVETLAFSATDEMLKELKDAEYVGKETYNGVPTRHYVFDETHLNLEELPPGTTVDGAQGNVYVAVDGGYLVHFDMTTRGVNVNLPTGDVGRTMKTGATTITADVTDVNQPITIELPPEALNSTAQAEDIPVPPDAEGVSNLSGIIAFQSPSTPQELADFYKAEMPKSGWTQTQDEQVGDLFTLGYTKDGRTAAIMIKPDATSGKTSVLATTGGQ